MRLGCIQPLKLGAFKHSNETEFRQGHDCGKAAAKFLACKDVTCTFFSISTSCPTASASHPVLPLASEKA